MKKKNYMLLEACLEGSIEKVKKSLKKSFFNNGADINVKNKDGNTPLIISTLHKQFEIINLLLSNQVDVNLPGNNQLCAIHIAAKLGNLNILKALINSSADLNVKNKDGNTPLIISTLHKQFEIINLLLSNQVDVNLPGNNQLCAIHIAAKLGNLDILKALINSGADLNKIDDQGYTPLHYAAKKGKTKAFRLILNSKSEVKFLLVESYSPLDCAIIYNRNSIIDDIIRNRDKYEISKEILNTAMVTAIFICRVDVLSDLLKIGIPIPKMSKDEYPIIFVPFLGISSVPSAEMIEMLLNNGADPCAKGKDNYNVLHEILANPVKKKPSFDIVLQLLHNNNVINDVTSSGGSPLHYAVFSIDLFNYKVGLEWCAFLIEKGANINCQNNHGDTPLHVAISKTINESSRNYRREIVQAVNLLLEKGADIHIENINNVSPWDMWPLKYGGAKWKPSVFRNKSDYYRDPSLKDKTFERAKSFVNSIKVVPTKNHYMDVPISEFNNFTRVVTNGLVQNEVSDEMTIEIFKKMVNGTCNQCESVINGEQILLVGAYQQAEGLITNSEFYLTLTKGRCPKCKSSLYHLGWLGENYNLSD